MNNRIILPGSEIHKLRHLNMLLSKDNKRLCDLLNSIKEDIDLMNDIEDKYSDLRKENEDLKQKLESLTNG
jgi:hypothetical protein